MVSVEKKKEAARWHKKLWELMKKIDKDTACSPKTKKAIEDFCCSLSLILIVVSESDEKGEEVEDKDLQEYIDGCKYFCETLFPRFELLKAEDKILQDLIKDYPI
ncbi:MAG: hypothetical protein MJ166_09190 [Clostridia bacterium]|nr:hypothetical protein [Clostridia bacterium]